MTLAMHVVKRSGKVEEFDSRKAINAILRVGTSQAEAEKILESIQPHLYDGITTEELYRKIRAQLPPCQATRFSLKKAIMLLGPDGHPFETFVARVFRELGYTVEVRQILKGRCVTHEVDLVIYKDGVKGMVECKFHNTLGTKSTIQDALYTWGRFQDLKDVNGITVPWLVTNTKFSSEVVCYAKCVGMRTICWKCSETKGLEKLVEGIMIYPITILDIKRGEQRTLLSHDFIICRDILERKAEVLALFPRETGERIIRKTEEFRRCVER
ncbi:MAG: ATP cone domain-containing protein [Methanomassiliicoccales archaeon]|nr:ATP cone domain-containing protein [Methanomassiliicoccales archaeon]